MNPERDVSLAPYTSLRVGGSADFFLHAQSGQDVAEGLRFARERNLPVRIIGGGSNLLVAEAGVEGLVIRCAHAAHRVEVGEAGPRLVADAGANFANVARRLAKQGLGGLEWAANVPGTIGGATVNNAGAFGGDTASCLVSATLVDGDGNARQVTADELGYAYRTSVLKRREWGNVAVSTVELRLVQKTPAEADGLVKEFNGQRMRSQPRISSAGSVFANPEGTFSGKLIEQAGLKRMRVGGAEISEQHANFIVNPEGATARDVYTLMRQTQDVVFSQTGIWLRPEIELLGRWTDTERAALRGPSDVDPSTPDGRQAVAHG